MLLMELVSSIDTQNYDQQVTPYCSLPVLGPPFSSFGHVHARLYNQYPTTL